MKPVKLIKNLENLDKSTWDVVRFGDVVREVKDVSRDPVSEGIERIIGLEHLNPLDIHIRTWGDTTNGTTFTKRFSKGQVLFGRRRAYQKKAVLADFDGICSGDIIVMEAIKERLDSGLLPFLVHGDGFYNWAVSTSAGSLSPRTKFKSLAEYEFRLPPMEMQKKLAELLWAVDETEEKYRTIEKQYLLFRKCFYNEHFSEIRKQDKLKNLPIKTISGLWKSDGNDSLQIKVIRSTEFSDFGEINLSKLSAFPVYKKSFEKSKLLKNDIILERSGGGPDQPVGRVCFFDLNDGDFSFSNFTSVIRVTDEKIINPKFLFYFLLHFYELGRTDRIQKQTTGIRNLDYDLYLNIDIPKPSLREQNDIVNKIDIIELKRKEISSIVRSLVTLKKSLINSIF